MTSIRYSTWNRPEEEKLGRFGDRIETSARPFAIRSRVPFKKLDHDLSRDRGANLRAGDRQRRARGVA